MASADERPITVGAIADRLAKYDAVVRWRYVILVIAALLFAGQLYRSGGNDWHFLTNGSRLLFGDHDLTATRSSSNAPGGLHLYANYPGLQIGPLSFLLATPFRILGSGGRMLAAVTMTAVAPALVYLLERTARRARGELDEQVDRILGWSVLVGGLLVVQAWSSVAVQYGHLDDALVLAFMVVALWGVVRGDATTGGVALGLAIASKPWGVIALPLLFVLPRRGRWRMAWLTVAIASAAWLPFIVADGETLGAIRPQLYTSPASILHLFGVAVNDQPAWVRPVQLAAALAAGSFAAWRGRWGAVLAVGIAVRLALDPGVFLYYTSGILLALFAWDLVRARWPTPVWTVAGFWCLAVVREDVLTDTTQAVLRLGLLIALLAAVLLVRGRDAGWDPRARSVAERDEARVRGPGLRTEPGVD